MERELAVMKPGQKKMVSKMNGKRVFLERATVGRKGRLVRESADGFQVLQTINF
jgi:hypothetical protein